MKSKLISEIMLALLALNMLVLTYHVPPVRAAAVGTVYIMADGSINPPTAPISTTDNITYCFTGDINYTAYFGIVVQRSNIIIDGKGHTLQGNQSGNGLYLTSINNMTIKNTNVKSFGCGIYLYSSSSNSITGNNITNNPTYGIWLESSSSNNISRNNVTHNGYGLSQEYSSSIYLLSSFNNSITGNNITNNTYGILLNSSPNNSMSANNITANSGYGISLIYSSNYNSIRENNITNSGELGIALGLYSNYNSVSGNNITANSSYGYGIYLSTYSSYNNIGGNNITNSFYGIYLYSSSSNSISGNNITNNDYGIWLVDYSDYNCINGNSIADNTFGIWLIGYSDYNSINRNNIADNFCGIYLLLYSSSNKICHNNFINNQLQVLTPSPGGLGSINVWDDGYPSGGNYWSDYKGTDLYSSPYQNETGSDGIGDKPYTIDADNADSYPLTKPYPWGSHDIGVTYIGEVSKVYFPPIVPLKTVVGVGFKLHISVFVMNYGVYTEGFNLTIYANTAAIDTIRNVTLAGRNSVVLNFTWDTTGFAKGYYTISAGVTPVPGETDKADNTFVDGTVQVSKSGDLNCDGSVDVLDLIIAAKALGTHPSDPKWNHNADINGDGEIDVLDLIIVAKYLGT